MIPVIMTVIVLGVVYLAISQESNEPASLPIRHDDDRDQKAA